VKVLMPDMPKLPNVMAFLSRIEDSGLYSNFGPIEREYRERISEIIKLDVDRIATATNATIAIQGCCQVMNLHKWQVPNWTFPATALAAGMASTSLELIEIDNSNWRMQIRDTGEAKGRVTVEPFGDAIQLSSYTGLQNLVIDAAASLGNLQDLSSLEPSQAIVFSLHATKILGCGEGSLIVFGDKDLCREFKVWSNFGFDGTRESVIPSSTNAKLSEISAAYALANLIEFPSKKPIYLEYRRIVNEISTNLGILPQFLNSNIVSPYWLVQFSNKELRDFAESELQLSGIETRRWWPKLLSEMKAFQVDNVYAESTPHAKYISETTLGLPFHLRMKVSDFYDVGQKLAQAIGFYT
jgi:dTDP-4-amino-4,6-dideoxygalactose transaminase